MTFGTDELTVVFRVLLAAYGPQQWWPADSQFEIAAGAVLVQRTAWRNAALAIAELKRSGLLDPAALERTDTDSIRTLIRPAGFSVAKAEYLRNLAAYFLRQGGVEGLSRLDTHALRAGLLSVRGIGPETADAMLLYLFERPVWIADAYAIRILSRLSGAEFGPPQQSALLDSWAGPDSVGELQELHALIVEHGKRHCRSRAHCTDCPLHERCSHAGTVRVSSAR